MTLFISIVAFIIIFSVLILIHELGHFVMAKRAGIKVEEFGIGMPPKMFKLFKKGDTEYTVNWIPFGGFVRMYGEDNHSLQAETDPQSYQSKSIRQRILVITAGVVMNFVLAIVLLTIGFMFGMEPIMVDLEDVMHNAREGKVMVQEYAVIKKLDSDSVWAQNGFQPEDQIIAINNEQNDIRGEIKALAAEEKEDIQIEYLRNNEVFSQEIKTIDQTFESGIQFYDFTALPVLRIFELEPNSSFYNVLKPNDLVLSVNQKQIFSRQQFLQNLNQTARSTIEVLRNGQKIEIDFENSFYPVMIYSFTSDSLAATSGLLPNDIITNVNGHEVFKFNDILDNLKPNTQNEFKVIRQGQELSLTARTDEEGKMGAMLIALESGEIGAFVSFPDFMNFSIVGNQKIPFYLAPVEALAECYRLSKLTIAMLGQVVSSIFTEFNVPEGIAGPVGIWQITDHYVKQGFLPLMRLCALLSLSLAVINIMPFPALDGGRLMFIIYEIFSGRKPNQNVESIIHFVGFILLILLLFVVTFKDITRLFE